MTRRLPQVIQLPTELFLASFFPQQHDAHVRLWRWVKVCAEVYGLRL